MPGTEDGHSLDGRIRIMVPEIKGSHAMDGEPVGHVGGGGPRERNLPDWACPGSLRCAGHEPLSRLCRDQRPHVLARVGLRGPSLPPYSQDVARAGTTMNARRRSLSRQQESEKDENA